MKRVKAVFKGFMFVSLFCLISTGFIASQSILIDVPFSFNSFSQDQHQSFKKDTIAKAGTTPKVVDLSGIWESSIGWKYNMKQKGSRFSWTVINRNQTASGSIAENSKDIQVIWTDNSSKGTTKGFIVEVNEQGKATFIEWDNGVYFHRSV